MAEWSYKPLYTYPIKRIGPTTLRNVREDGKVLRREKSALVAVEVTEVHWFTRAEAQAVIALYKTKGQAIGITKAGYDPQDATDLIEKTWFFMEAPEMSFAGPDHYPTIVRFRRDDDTAA